MVAEANVMKKKQFIIVLMLIPIIALSGCTKQNSVSDNKGKENNSYNLIGEKINFVCSDLKGNDFYILFNDIYMNNSIYNQGQLYSNNQNCKKIDNISYDRYVILNSSARGDIFIKNNDAYVYTSSEKEGPKLIKYDGVLEHKIISLEEDVISISLESTVWTPNNNSNSYKFYVLKNDGNVYLYETVKHKIVNKNKIVYSSEEYGKIKYFYYSSNDSKSIENIILLSDKGLYTNETINNDDCIKYADIECKKEFKLNEEYDKVKEKIIFFNKDYIVDKDYNLYDNRFVELEYIP